MKMIDEIPTALINRLVRTGKNSTAPIDQERKPTCIERLAILNFLQILPKSGVELEVQTYEWT